MVDEVTRYTIEKNLRGGGCEKPTNDIPPNYPKAQPLQDLQKEGLRNRIKCFRNIQLEEQTWLFFSVQELGCLLHHHKIILDKPPFYKSTLIFRNQLIKVPTQLICQDLGNQFGETMDKTYRSCGSLFYRFCLLTWLFIFP
jgi:hypothetical protein